MNDFALFADRILTPEGFVEDSCVVVRGGSIEGILPGEQCPRAAERIYLTGALVPGFIDLQVNGGNGVLFNDCPTVEGIIKIAEAHRAFGTTGLFPTLISDDLDVIARAIAAVDQAIVDGVPGILGVHLEGPFLNASKKGIHDASKLRGLDEDAIDLIASIKHGKILLTLAPERTSLANIRTLANRGVILSAGHTAADYDQIMAAIACGVTGFTHLFNAMSGLGSRAPGVVGAALDSVASWCSIIVDGHHVHPATLRVALAAKGARKLVLVTDAMPMVGSSEKSFVLDGQRITSHDGKCISADGTLAGADLNMAQAVANAVTMMNLSIESAIEMASSVPAAAVGLDGEVGAIRAGLRADFALLDADGKVTATWIDGIRNDH